MNSPLALITVWVLKKPSLCCDSFEYLTDFTYQTLFFSALSRAIMVLAPSESSILSSDNGLSFHAVSFHSAGMFRVAVGPLVVYRKRIWNRLCVILLKYSLWPGNLFSLWYFSWLFWARPWFFLSWPIYAQFLEADFQFFRNLQYMPPKLSQEAVGLYRQ